ncbi:hypothetical protein BDQ17DRAFT_817048 [Cyathus striatus]|nr:hypothetical protein BDQ17DRAFT_817048 [Cyathus striatus]
MRWILLGVGVVAVLPHASRGGVWSGVLLLSAADSRVSYTAGDGVRQRGMLGVPASVLSSLLGRGKSTSDVGHFLSQLRVASFGVRCCERDSLIPRRYLRLRRLR